MKPILSKIIAFFHARLTLTSFILLTLVSLLLADIIPQQFIDSEIQVSNFRQKYNAAWKIIEFAGFDHVYSTYWFNILILLVLISILFSLISQVGNACRKTFILSNDQASAPVGTVASLADIKKTLRRRLYFRLSENAICARFVKNPWGYWGNVFLHLGLFVSVAGPLVLASTFQSMRIKLYEGETVTAGSILTESNSGILAKRPIFPINLKLEGLLWQFWPDSSLRDLQSIFTVGPDADKPERKIMGVNKPLHHDDWRFTQGSTIGHAFFLEIMGDNGGKYSIALQIDHPRSRNRASYIDFQVDGLIHIFKAKYFIDELGSGEKSKPTLFLKLEDPELSEPVLLKQGHFNRVGPYSVKLVETRKWVSILCTSYKGIPMVFGGFFLIIIGSACIYIFPPREVIILKGSGTLKLDWKASSFKPFFIDEYASILTELNNK